MDSRQQKLTTNFYYLLTLVLLLPYYIHIPLLLLALVCLVFKERQLIIEKAIHYPWINLFIIYVSINALLQRNYIGALVAFAFWGYFIIMMIYYQVIEWKSYLVLLKILSISSIPLAILAIYNYLIYALSHGYGVWYIFKYHNIQIRAEATFFNANYYGFFCIMIILVSLYLILKEAKLTWKSVLYLIAILFNIISIVLTGSRAFIPLLILILVWFIIWAKPKLAFPFILMSGGILIYLIIFPETLPRLTSIATAFEDRFDIWQVAWNLYRSNPIFGRGAMGYYHLYHLYTLKSDMHAHQLYLNLLLNHGIVGIILIIIISIPLIKALKNLFVNRQYALEFSLLSSIILLVLLHGLIDVAIFWTQTAYILLVILLPLVKISFKKKI